MWTFHFLDGGSRTVTPGVDLVLGDIICRSWYSYDMKVYKCMNRNKLSINHNGILKYVLLLSF